MVVEVVWEKIISSDYEIMHTDEGNVNWKGGRAEHDKERGTVYQNVGALGSPRVKIPSIEMYLMMQNVKFNRNFLPI